MARRDQCPQAPASFRLVILLILFSMKIQVHLVTQDANDLARIKQWDNVIIKLMRRYKYLEKMLSEEMKKILVYLRGFTEQHRTRLAQITAIWCCSGLILPNTIVVVINEHQVGASSSNTFISILLKLAG